jgi:Zn-dependent protease/Tfp pilus assembly protein PilF
MFGLILGLLTMPLLLVETAILRQQSVTVDAMGNILVYPLIVLVSITLHELGHAAVAHAVGLRVLRIEVGVGRRVARQRWRGLRLQLNTFPLFGITILGAESRAPRRWQVWLTILAGPLTTLAIVVTTLAVSGLDVGDVLWPSGAVAGSPALACLIGFQNLWMLVRNLLPLRILGHHSDGMQLCKVPFMPARDLETLRLMPLMLAAADHMEADEFDAAQHVLEAALEIAPGSLIVRCNLATLAVHRGRNPEAREQFVALAGEPALEAAVRVIVLNNLAWVDYVLGDAELRDEADRYSEEVIAKWKHSPYAMGTRGAVLGWLGQHYDAIALLERSFVRHTSSTSRALSACSLAISHAAHGDVDIAERWIARARKNHEACPLLKRAAAAIVSARRSEPSAAAATEASEFSSSK